MRVLDVVGPTAVAALGEDTARGAATESATGPVRPPKWVDRSLHLTVRERSVVAADQDVVALSLGAHDGGELPRWRPGAHLDVTLPSGAVRQYSLCGDPRDRFSYRIAVRRIPNGNGDRLSCTTG